MTITVTSLPSTAQDERRFVEQTIVEFVNGAAHRDVYNMHYLLHENFQAVIDEFSTLSKSAYMKLLSERKIAEMDQKVEILFLDVSSNTAVAKVKVITKVEISEAYYSLFMNANGSWQILYILPYVKSVKRD